MPAHIHAELMKQYAEDAMQTEEPWKLWQAHEDDYEGWLPLKFSPSWNTGIEYRRKPKFEVTYNNNLNDAGWDFTATADELGVGVSSAVNNNNIKPILKVVIQKYLDRMTKEERQQLLDSI